VLLEEPVERVLEPVLRVVVPVLRLRLSCCDAEAVARLPEEEPEEREALAEVVLLDVVEREAPAVPRERVCASISGAVSMASAIAKVTAVVRILLIASKV